MLGKLAALSCLLCLCQEEARWADVDLPVVQYKDVREVFILGSIDTIVEQLDDSLVTLNTILGSRFVGPIREVVEAAHQRMLLLQVRMLCAHVSPLSTVLLKSFVTALGLLL